MTSSGNKKARQALIAYSFLLPTLLVMATFQFYPMLHAFYLSTWEYFPNSPKNQFVGIDNFTRLLRDRDFWMALQNSVLYLLVVPAVICSSLLLAVLVEPQIPGVGFFRACYYVPVVTMMVVVAFAWKLIFDTDNGLINQALMQTGLFDEPIPWLTSGKMALWTIMSVTVWKGLGYYMVMFLVALKAVPVELKEAARIDGARAHQMFLFVTVPMLWPTITLVSILSSISALQVFEEIYMMTSGRFQTATLVYEIYTTGFDMSAGGGLEMGYACAMGVALFSILFVFTAFAVKTMDNVYKTE